MSHACLNDHIVEAEAAFDALCVRCACSPCTGLSVDKSWCGDANAGRINIMYTGIKALILSCLMEDDPLTDPGTPPTDCTTIAAWLDDFVAYTLRLGCSQSCRVQVGDIFPHRGVAPVGQSGAERIDYYWFDDGKLFEPGTYIVTYAGGGIPNAMIPARGNFQCLSKRVDSQILIDCRVNICTRIGETLAFDSAIGSDTLHQLPTADAIAAELGQFGTITLAVPASLGVSFSYNWQPIGFEPGGLVISMAGDQMLFDLEPCPQACVESGPVGYYNYGFPSASTNWSHDGCATHYITRYKLLPGGQSCNAQGNWCEVETLDATNEDFSAEVINTGVRTLAFTTPSPDGSYCGVVEAKIQRSTRTFTRDPFPGFPQFFQQVEFGQVIDITPGPQFCFVSEGCTPLAVSTQAFVITTITDQRVTWTPADECYDFFKILIHELDPGETCATPSNWCDNNTLTEANADTVLTTLGRVTEQITSLDSGSYCFRIVTVAGPSEALAAQFCADVPCDQADPEGETILPFNGQVFSGSCPRLTFQYGVTNAVKATLFIEFTDLPQRTFIKTFTFSGTQETTGQQIYFPWLDIVLSLTRKKWFGRWWIVTENDCGVPHTTPVSLFQCVRPTSDPGGCSDQTVHAWTVINGQPHEDLTPFFQVGLTYARWSLGEQIGTPILTGVINGSTLTGLPPIFVPPVSGVPVIYALRVLC